MSDLKTKLGPVALAPFLGMLIGNIWLVHCRKPPASPSRSAPFRGCQGVKKVCSALSFFNLFSPSPLHVSSDCSTPCRPDHLF